MSHWLTTLSLMTSRLCIELASLNSTARAIIVYNSVKELKKRLVSFSLGQELG
jgi:hypothetical protein